MKKPLKKHKTTNTNKDTQIEIHDDLKELFEAYCILYTQMNISIIQNKINSMQGVNYFSLELSKVDLNGSTYCLKSWEMLLLQSIYGLKKIKFKIVKSNVINIFDFVEDEFNKILLENCYIKIYAIDQILNVYNSTLPTKKILTKKNVANKTKLTQQKLVKKSIDENFKVLRLNNVV